MPAIANASAPKFLLVKEAPMKMTAAKAVTAGVALMIVEPITPVVIRIPNNIVTVNPIIPKAAIAPITRKSERSALANLLVRTHTKGAKTRVAITIRKNEAVKTEKCWPMILLNGVVVPNSAIPATSWTTDIGDTDRLLGAMEMNVT